jgi:hypothetical protein
MLLLRAAFLEVLLCLHFIGAAILFRRLCPRESPWICFLVPVVTLVAALNFVEHFIPLSNLGWLLPITVGAMIWAIFQPGRSWEGLRFPTILFLAIFSFVFLLKCLSPIIANYTEGIFNLTRILNYCLGGTLPPKDCWLPPYDYGAYYTFQHYGAAVLKRLFSLDLGTAYNLSFAFLLAWVVLMGAGVAHSITGKMWIAVATIIVLLAGSTGSVIFLLFLGHHGVDYEVSTAINDCWNDRARNPFWWFSEQDQYHPELKLLPPTYTLYYSEFHANLGGSFITISSLLACSEIFKTVRTNWSWILLAAFPMLVIVTSAWFFFIVLFICVGSLAIALLAGRRPQDWRFACIGAAVALVLIWPSFYSLTGNPVTQAFSWTVREDHTPLWMFALQWWPVWLPWLFLCFIWDRLNLMCRWIHAAIPILLIGVEFCTFGNHGLTIEKMWGAVYGIGLVTLIPMVLMQKNFFFRMLSVFLIAVFTLCLGAWMNTRYSELDRNVFFRLQGDSLLLNDHQTKRILQVLKGLHGVIVLPGKSYWDYNSAPSVVAFSENLCYVAYFFQEEQSGHGEEAGYRNDLNNAFYAGKLDAPLPFLLSNNIGAVLIWPEDAISDDLLQKMQQQIGSSYYYINCKMDEPVNAGVFVRRSLSTPAGANLPQAPLDLSPTPNP